MNRRIKKQILRQVSLILIGSLSWQILYPLKAYALTTGPSQPEVQTFEPVGTTDMVDLFTGDFVYNIPLMDVEGYPINISYHGGVNGEQEASWVGLGWNINPGVINRSVRGLPDDFNGDTLVKTLHIKDEQNVKVGASFGIEPAGVGQPIVNFDASLGGYVNISNYRGVSAGLNLDAGVRLVGFVSAGVNMGVGSQTGADIDYHAGLSMSSSQILGATEAGGGVGVNFNSGYNSRTGLKDRSWTVTGSANMAGRNMNGPSWATTVPISLKNFVPVITNASHMYTYSGNIRIGGVAAWTSLWGSINGMSSVLKYDDDGSRRSYGYLFAQNARDSDINDFSRDKDGMFNKTMKYLPPATMTYDVYNVTGQGTGGSFRPFRNDFGSVYDPLTTSSSDQKSAGVEASLGWLFGAGGNVDITSTEMRSGPWLSDGNYTRKFTGNVTQGSVYEPSYFKQAGELTKIDPAYFTQVQGYTPVSGRFVQQVGDVKANSKTQRDPRANMITYLDGGEASLMDGIASSRNIISYNSNNGFASGPVVPTTQISRYQMGSPVKRKPYAISEIVQTQTDGKKYVYGIPAMNNVQKEMVFAVSGPSSDSDMAKGLVAYDKGHDDTKGNSKGMDNYYSATVTPAYAHSYLLTSVLSTDYIDIKGDGPTDDDYGSYTKFNYSRKDSDYRWRSPIEAGKAHYNQGFKTDKRDDRGSYMIGSREEWMMHSMETKNYVAEFYISPRLDGTGASDTITRPEDKNCYVAPYNVKGNVDSSYKLDSIKLYNKHDRFINGVNAVPIKTVMFVYDYSLCPKVPNVLPGSPANTGKLTLKKIFFRYGNSDKSMISPYQFNYSSCNPAYSIADKDRWGGYKPNNPGFTNYEFPFVDQNDTALNTYASAWSLTEIKLPTGGTIKVNYEADDYAYTQDKVASEMFMIKGAGNSPNFSPGNKLYNGRYAPNLYLYFKRRPGDEITAWSTFKDRYLKGDSVLYFNASVRLKDNDYEPIKGYAVAQAIDICPNNSDYGYIKLRVQEPEQGEGLLNPITYTALNVARYNLPQIIFPGNSGDASDIENVISGLAYSMGELFSVAENPIIRMVDNESKAKDIDLNKSYVRLNNPGMHRKGGGQRVKSLLFYDNWSQLAGGTAQDATYGKQYDYTTDYTGDASGGIKISSGVASYEPQAGGDENPLRLPVKYEAQSSSKFPPNDPVDLFQETPIGESFYPSPVVGYSRVTVKSINSDKGRSSQGEEIHEFYTAKDFPVQFSATPIDVSESKSDFSLKSQTFTMKAFQGYTIVLNDMHGKVKKVEQRIIKPATGASQLVSYQLYNYNTANGRLDNTVDVMEYQPQDHMLKKVQRQLGVETDITFDSREKKEESSTQSYAVNVNATNILFALIPIPLGYPWTTDYHNQFNSATATKIIQQYGIVKEVVSYQEGAITTARNEVFDQLTGQPVITSVNNEYNDKEYSVTYPAYWAYNQMGPAYENTGYTDSYAFATYDKDNATNRIRMVLRSTDGRNTNYRLGDEVYMACALNNSTPYQYYSAWVVGYVTIAECCCPVLAPRNGSWPVSVTAPNLDTAKFVSLKIIRSGAKNQLGDAVMNYTGMNYPLDASGYLTSALTNLISVSGREYSNQYTGVQVSASAQSNLNDYLSGKNQVYRPFREYAYQRARDYSPVGVRRAGLFNATALWTNMDPTNACSFCIGNGSSLYGRYIRLQSADSNWIVSKTITSWSPFGFELENMDANHNFSSAQYGYNNQLPVAVAQNARQYEIFTEGFEDYNMVMRANNLVDYRYSPLSVLFPFQALGSSAYNVYQKNTTSGSSNLLMVNTTAHSGSYALQVTNANLQLSLPVSGLFSSALTSTVPVPSFNTPTLHKDRSYVFSVWVKQVGAAGNTTSYSPAATVSVAGQSTAVSFVAKSPVIEGWQKFEATITQSQLQPTAATSVTVSLPAGYYVDDIRMMPLDANMKSFVYNPINQKLMATLDENNYASFYEYDQEGNLVRTKKETDNGVMTISESRSANVKFQ